MRTLTRDSITVIDDATTRVPDPIMRSMLANLWALNRAVPATTSRVVATVKPSTAPEFEVPADILAQYPDARIDGSTVPATGEISLNEIMLSDPLGTAGGNMPVARTTDRWLYVLVHEFGHASDRAVAGDSDTQSEEWLLWTIYSDALSVYAGDSPPEAYAEAFAEWILTHGRTHNGVVETYADQFAWPRLTLPGSHTPNIHTPPIQTGPLSTLN